MTLKIFSLNACDFYIGDSIDACRVQAALDMGDDMYDEIYAHELTQEELDHYKFHCEDNPGVSITFADQLANELIEGGVFPRMFASTEY
jgi:hypothetical protein